jgi:hypothetical protein
VKPLEVLGRWRGLGLIGPVIGACTAGEGTVEVTAYGESFIEEGIPASEVGDGWAVGFDRFEVIIRDVQVAGASFSAPESVDLSEPSNGAGHELARAVAAQGNHARPRFTIDRIEIDGVATLGSENKTFGWVFDVGTAYEACDTTTFVPEGGVGTLQITIHADHLFYDSLVAEEPQVLFQAMADADGNQDGDISQAELAAAGIGSYDPGSEGGIEDLWAWLVAAVRTVGHVDGEGHCDAAALASN